MDQETDAIRKTRKDKKATVCSVKRRRYDGCGVCGSQNIVSQGVVYCEMCGEEADFIKTGHFACWWREVEERESTSCNCLKTPPFGKKHETRKFRPLREVAVEKCTDCGSVKGFFCPNCGKSTPANRHGPTCWRHWDGRLFCQKCGYRNC